MKPDRFTATPRSARAAGKQPLAELAEMVFSIARELTLRVERDPQMLHLSSTEINVLRYVAFHSGARPKEVAERLDLKRSNFSVALRSLRNREMVRVEPDRQDRRSMRLHATVKAEKNLEQHRALWARLLGDSLAEPLDVNRCLDVLQRIEGALRTR